MHVCGIWSIRYFREQKGLPEGVSHIVDITRLPIWQKVHLWTLSRSKEREQKGHHQRGQWLAYLLIVSVVKGSCLTEVCRIFS